MLVGTPNLRKFYQNQPPAGVATPSTAPTLAASGSGGALAAGTYYVVYTWVNSNNPNGQQETVMSPIASITITVGQTITATLPALGLNATSANVYIGTATGQANMHLQGSTTSTSFAQTNALNVASTLSPTTNTTGSGMTVYTAQTNTPTQPAPYASTAIKEITLVNTSNASATVTIGINGVGVTNLIVAAKSVLPNDSIVITQLNTALNAADTLQVVQGTTNAINVVISGIEVQ